MSSFRIFLGLVVGWTFAGMGCVTHYHRPTSPAGAARILAIPGKSEVKLVTASPTGPVVNRGVLAPFNAQEFSLVDREGKRVLIPFDQTQSITYNSHADGAALGFLYGAIPGFFAGLAMGDLFCGMQGDDPHCGVDAGAGIAAALLTGGIGAVIGGLVGKDTTIAF